MIGVIILALLLVSIMASSSYTMLIMIEQNQNLAKAQEEKNNIQAITIALTNSLMPIGKNNVLIAPIGTFHSIDDEVLNSNPNPANVHQGLPDFLPVSKRNAWGNEYVYCPVGDNITPSEFSNYGGLGFDSINIENNVLDGDLDPSLWTSEDILVKKTTGFDGVDYSAGIKYSDYQFSTNYLSENVKDKVLAVVISRRGDSNSSCFDLRYSDKEFYTASGRDIVFSITRETSKLYQKDTPIIIDVSKYDFSSIVSVNSLFSKWDSLSYNDYTVNFNTLDDRNLESSIDLRSNESAEKRNVRFYSDSNILIKNPDGLLKTILFDNVSVYIKNLRFDNSINLVFNNSNVVLDNVSTKGNVSFSNSNVDIIEDFKQETTSGMSNVANFVASNVNLKGKYLIDLTGGYSSLLENSLIRVNSMSSFKVSGIIHAKDDNGLNIRASLIDIDSSSTLIAYSSLLTKAVIHADYSSDSIVKAFGDVDISNSKITTGSIGASSSPLSNNAITLMPGSSLNLSNQAEVGDSSIKVNVGINDMGASNISGDSSVELRANTCAKGFLFSHPDPAYPATSKQLEGTMSFLNNKSAWRCL